MLFNQMASFILGRLIISLVVNQLFPDTPQPRLCSGRSTPHHGSMVTGVINNLFNHFDLFHGLENLFILILSLFQSLVLFLLM